MFVGFLMLLQTSSVQRPIIQGMPAFERQAHHDEQGEIGGKSALNSSVTTATWGLDTELVTGLQIQFDHAR